MLCNNFFYPSPHIITFKSKHDFGDFKKYDSFVVMGFAKKLQIIYLKFLFVDHIDFVAKQYSVDILSHFSFIGFLQNYDG